jgi:hypothetical protein
MYICSGRGDSISCWVKLATELNIAPTCSRSRRHSRTEINIINNAELRANAQSIYTLIRVSRLKNTSLMYNPKQKEFKV